MIERFNFWVPGLALLGMLWFPLWWLGNREIPAAWWSAAVALVLGYVLGHIVARLGQNALTYTGERGQQPSDSLLDPSDNRLPVSVKAHIIQAIRRHFDLEIEEGEHRTQNARSAFFLCRRALLREDAASYAEQFEGLYSMFRGLAAVALLSSGYYLGWGTSDLLVTPWFVDAAEYAAIPIVLLVTFLTERRWLLILSVFAVLLFLAGLHLGATLVTTALSREASLVLLLIASGSVFLAVRMYLGYRYFAEQFAMTVYRDFFVLDRMSIQSNET